MKDCDGNTLAIGDRIAIQAVDNKDLIIMPVVGFTNARVKVNRIKTYRKDLYRTIDPKRVVKVFTQLKE